MKNTVFIQQVQGTKQSEQWRVEFANAGDGKVAHIRFYLSTYDLANDCDRWCGGDLPQLGSFEQLT